MLHGSGRACMDTMQVEKDAWGFYAGQKGCVGVCKKCCTGKEGYAGVQHRSGRLSGGCTSG